MPISVSCSCGKALRVKDEWAGKTVTCPACGGTFVAIAGGGRAPAPAPASSNITGAEVWTRGRLNTQGQGKPTIGSRIQLSPLTIAFIVFAIVVPGFVLFAKMGPLKAHKQWVALEPQANSDVDSVLTLAIQSYLQQQHGYDPSYAHYTPGVDAVTFEPSPMMVKLPDKIAFTGKGSTGFFKGTYFTRTREVQAQVPADRATLDITGRVNEKGVQAEIGGKAAKVIIKPHEKAY